jgi:D-psicose/D-tagatose/L-ribulose 3-epimerase
MQLAIGENAWWGTSVDRVEGIKATSEIGFDGYSIFPVDLTPQLRRSMREVLNSSKMVPSTFTTVVTSLADWNADVRKFTVNWAKNQVDIGYDFGFKIMIMVPGEYVWAKQEIDPKVQWNWLLEGVREIADYAKSLGIVIGLEAETPPYSMLRTVDTLVKFVDDAQHPAVMANVDTVHMFVLGDSPQEMKRLKGKLVDVHLADTNEKVHHHHPPGSGIIPLREYIKALKEIGFEGPINVEIEWTPYPDKIHEWVRDAYTASTKMFEELGIPR